MLDLVTAAAAVDGGEPLSEDAHLALTATARTDLRHLLLREPAGGAAAGSGLVGYAQLTGASAELLVAPRSRRRGHGTSLARALERVAGGGSTSPVGVWSHAETPGSVTAAAALAERLGYRRVRELWRMARPLGPAAPLPPLVLPDDVQLRAFEPGRDEQAWLAVNAAAFATHPEQGRWTSDDLLARMAEPWFDPAGFLLAVDAQGGRLLASHWTKEVDATTGEVYVVGVAPAAQGRGLGTVVVLAGLHHLDLRGKRVVRLYVEGDNAAAVRLYTRLGFSREGADVVYQRP